MALRAQRFAGDPTLEACVAEGYRLKAGDPNVPAITRLQLALSDLGYPIGPAGADGRFGDDTGTAVSAYKTDENLQPTDPVASTGTIGRLDNYFASEPPVPDDPDPSADGLMELAYTAVETAADYVSTAIGLIDQLPLVSPQPDNPVWVFVAQAVARAFHLDATPDGQAAVDGVVRPALVGCENTLRNAQQFAVVPLTQADYRSRYPGGAYLPLRLDQGSLIVTPPFRNAVSTDSQTVSMIRVGIVLSNPTFETRGFPQTARYESLGDAALQNTVSYAAFALECTNNLLAMFRPLPRWL